jgi:putative transposase
VAAVYAAHPVSERRATRLLGFGRSTVRYRPHREPQEALRIRLRELAGSRVRFGYRRLTVLLRREGWLVNAKRIYRLYTEEGLLMRTKPRKRAAPRPRVPHVPATAPNQRWAMDFMHHRLLNGRPFRVLTVLDLYTRECLRLVAETSLAGQQVAEALEPIVHYRGAPQAITVDNGSEFTSRALEGWAAHHGISLDFISPGKPGENPFIEACTGRLRDECLEVECFFSLQDAQAKLERWREDYNRVRPHSALQDRTPAEVVATWAPDSRELVEALN